MSLYYLMSLEPNLNSFLFAPRAVHNRAMPIQNGARRIPIGAVVNRLIIWAATIANTMYEKLGLIHFKN